MTFDEVCRLPNGTPVRLADGRVGRMAAWHKSQQAVGVIVPGEGVLRTLSAEQLRLLPDDACEEVAPQ
jgi:hypothetical protein